MVKSFFIGVGEEVNLCQQLQTVFILSVLAILFMYCAYTLYRVFKIIGFFSHFNDNEKLHIFGHLLTNFFSYVEVHKF